MRRYKAAILACIAILTAATTVADPSPMADNIRTKNLAFSPGEKLTYSVSWSQLIEAGIAVMEVKEGRAEDGTRTLNIMADTKSVGILDTVFPVRDKVISIVDADDLASMTYDLRESHGNKKRQRNMTFDREKNTVRLTVNDGTPEFYPVPNSVLDALSSLYYVRTRQDFVVGKPIVVDVFDGGKTWAVEIHVLGRERISTPAGEFDTIKVKTYPKYEGVFMHKGEIFIWFSDDARKIPVLMKSTISIGSIMATLTAVDGAKGKP